MKMSEHGTSLLFLPFWRLDAKGGESSPGICMHCIYLRFAFSHFPCFICMFLSELYLCCTLELNYGVLWNLCHGYCKDTMDPL